MTSTLKCRLSPRRPRTDVTEHVVLNRRLCEACFHCVEACPNDVLGTIQVAWHAHAVIRRPDLCIGCLRCVKGCAIGALSSRASSED